MADKEQLRILQQGSAQWNEWREKHPERNIDLSLATLSGAILSSANLSFSDLSFATLNNARLNNANLSFSDLSFATLNSSTLNNANLSFSDLTSATLNNANLNNVNLSGAIIGWTSFGDQDLRNVNGLDTIRHRGPSPLSINTIYLSEGDISEVFIRGTGAPESFVEYIQTLAKPIQYSTCFISYSSKNQDFAEQLYTDLQSKGVRCWFAPEDMKTGEKIRHRIDTSIHLYDKLLLILSEASVASQWVEHKVETALGKEFEGKPNVLFPVRLDDAVMQSNVGWASRIKLTRHITNFSQWRDYSAYQKAFTRLLRNLKANVVPRSE